ncbi:putative calcineurin-like phosphoesterase [Elsinoe ampelina]|uniref:Putative calcineurin-like phosphoesterase n=1 Tax=Elsinoe ampelina TaxID=302913 RepID=A0A6A6GKV7_9PEZI|nr:putative calcineurin-like phosphoesterase [Elsinoe ampelina]
MTPFRAQVQSDLHLEIGQQYNTYSFPVTAPYLILAGDIGRLIDYKNYLDFLKEQAARYKQVFLVLGNHEFYEGDYEWVIEKSQKLCQETSLDGKVTLLHRTRWDDPDSEVTILGCTLWSHIPAGREAIVESRINDFSKIGSWTAEEHNRVHQEELAWIKEQVSTHDAGNASKRRYLVVTHHAPCMEGTSAPQHMGNPWNCAFASDLLDQDWPGVHTWIFGHTHFSADFIKNGIRVVANQRGYVFPWGARELEVQAKGEGVKRLPHAFDEEMVVEL